MPGSGDVRHYPARPHPRRRPAPNLLSQGHELMALFGRDRDGGTGAPRAVPVPAMPVDGIAPREVAMFERERNTSQFVGPGGIDTFLGRGTKVNGKLVLEGTARIDGQVEGEISAQDALTVGEGAVVNAKISGTSIVIEGGVTGDVTARERLELRASALGMAASRGRSRGGNSRLHAPAATPSSARRASVVAPRMMYSLTSITEIATPTSRQSGPRPPPSRSSSCIPPSISRRAICSRAPLDLDHPEVPQDVLHAQPDGRIVVGTPPEMIPEPDEFALGQAWGHQDRPLAMPAGHEDRHAAAPIKSRLRAEESRMGGVSRGRGRRHTIQEPTHRDWYRRVFHVCGIDSTCGSDCRCSRTRDVRCA